GQALRLARVEVEPVELPEFRAADVLAEHEAVALRVRRDRRDRLVEEGELLARAARRLDAMHLRRAAEARGDQQPGAVGGPAAEPRAARVRVALQLLDQGGRDLGDVLADAVAALDAPDLGGTRRGAGECGDEAEKHQDRTW